MIIYYGGYQPVEAPRIIEGEFVKDFGNGIYCTELKEQAVRWSKRYPTPVISSYDYQEDSSLRILYFKEMAKEWLDFIVDYRNGIKHDYDVVIGAMANYQICNYIPDCINGVLTKEQFWILAKFKYPTHQINFYTPQGLECLTFKASE